MGKKNRRFCGRLNLYWRKERRVPPQQRKQLASTCFVIIFGDKNTAFWHATCRKGNITRTTLPTIYIYLAPFMYFLHKSTDNSVMMISNFLLVFYSLFIDLRRMDLARVCLFMKKITLSSRDELNQWIKLKNSKLQWPQNYEEKNSKCLKR